MEERRKTLGKRLQRARRAAGYRSAKAFADAIDVSESSVARAEAGYQVVADGVFTAIETGLRVPLGISNQYIRDGDDALLERINPTFGLNAANKGSSAGPATKDPVDWSEEDIDDDFFEFIASKLERYGLKPTKENVESMRAQWEKDAAQSDTDGDQSKRYGQN